MEYFYTTLLFILGLLIGSFLNVSAYRVPKGISVSYPPSHCPQCGVKINSYDNVPLVSYMILRGRCRECHLRISPRYPLIELLTGILWLASYYHFGLTLQLVFALFFITVLITLSAIDYETKLIPNKILLPAMAISVIVLPLQLANIKTLPVVVGPDSIGATIGFFAGGGMLYAIAVIAPLLFKKEAMGGGDIKLAAFMGLYLGGYVLLALFIGFFLGAIVGVALIAKDKSRSKDMIPFGPFLAAGSIITVFIGPRLWHGYIMLAGL